MLTPAYRSLSRRSWLRGALATPAALAFLRRLREDLPSPQLAKPNVLRFVAGIRPQRMGGVRLEREQVGKKIVIHNYGHAASGVTLSWGTAEEAVRLLAEARRAPAEVAVLGAGAVGLATARVLLEQGYNVTVVAKDFPPHTTSNLAGAVWHPGNMMLRTDRGKRALLGRMLKRSWARYQKLAADGEVWGVGQRDLYEHFDEPRVQGNEGMPIAYHPVERLPFTGGDRPGHRTRTFLIQPPIYLAELQRQVLRAGGHMRQQAFDRPEEFAALPQSLIVNCMGYGAKAVFRDPRVVPVRGQLVHLFPERLPYLLTGRHGYCFPRADAVVLGGTFERGVADSTPQRADCEAILARHREFFGV